MTGPEGAPPLQNQARIGASPWKQLFMSSQVCFLEASWTEFPLKELTLFVPFFSSSKFYLFAVLRIKLCLGFTYARPALHH